MHIKKLVEWLLATMLIFGVGLTINIALAEEAESDSVKEESKESTKKSSDTEKATENKKDEDNENKEDETSKKEDDEDKEGDASKKPDETSDKDNDKEGEKKSSENEEEEEESRAQAKNYKNEVRQSKSSDDDRNVSVKITETMPFLDVYHDNEIVRIKRIQDKDYKVTNSFARTSRKCPPFCIRPIKLPGDIETVGELEVLEFLKTKVRKHNGLLIDARLKDWHVKGTIPGSVSIPFTMFTNDVHDLNTLQLLELLGAKEDDEGNLDFSEAIDIILYCNGPWCGQSPRAIKNLLKLGYPSEKMFWYRGGMQAWQSFGLTIITP